MGSFSADWLALREPADFAARSSRLAHVVAAPLDGNSELNVLDLATGTGSNVRYLVDRLPAQQRWLLVDRDSALLEHARDRMCSWATTHGYQVSPRRDELLLHRQGRSCFLATRQVDLSTMEDAGLFVDGALVTASALLDLVSTSWLQWLAESCRENGARALFALTYDGRIRCSPEEPDDAMVQELVNRHQQTDKGFGLAAGPDAIDRAEEFFVRVGYRVERERSDWMLDSDARELQLALVTGWAEAAAATAPGRAQSIASWRARRLAHITAARSEIVVGHTDLAALIK
jgi:hypothetical protein